MKDHKKNISLDDLDKIAGGFESDEIYERYGGFVCSGREMIDNAEPLPCPSCQTKHTSILRGLKDGRAAWVCEACGKLHYVAETVKSGSEKVPGTFNGIFKC